MKETNRPIVSIIIPSLNVRDYVEECIDGAINQSLRDLEVICIDAGSTDGTIEILQEYKRKDERISIIASDKKSYGYQMNLGLKAAKGKYLAILESDDVIEKDMYETLARIADQKSLQVIQCDYRTFICEDGKKKYKNVYRSKDKSLYNRIYSSQNKEIFFTRRLTQPGLYRIDFLRDINLRWNESPGAAFQDNGFWFQVFSQVERLMFIKKRYYQLRRDREESSINFNGKKFDMRGEGDYIREFLSKNKKLEDELKTYCSTLRVYNYDFTLKKLDDQYKLEFLELISDDYSKIKENNEFDEELFTKKTWNRINSIIDDYKLYYFKEIAVDYSPIEITEELKQKLTNEEYDMIEDANKQIKAFFKKNCEQEERHEAKLTKLKESASYRIGRMITKIPRSIKIIVKKTR